MNVYYHRGAMGDIVQALPTIRAMGKGELVCSMAPHRVESLATFLRLQRCITGVRHVPRPMWNQRIPGVTCDLNAVFDLPGPAKRSIIVAHAQALGVSLVAPASPWLDPDPSWVRGAHDRVLVNRTHRYRHPRAPWAAVLKKERAIYAEMAFVGTPKEHADFQAEFGEITYLPTETVADLARAIYESRKLLCSQSLAFTIALGFGIDHVLECAPDHTNCLYPVDWQKVMEGTV